MFDNIIIDELNNYFREVTKEKCQEETTREKDETLTILQIDNQSKKD